MLTVAENCLLKDFLYCLRAGGPPDSGTNWLNQSSGIKVHLPSLLLIFISYIRRTTRLCKQGEKRLTPTLRRAMMEPFKGGGKSWEVFKMSIREKMFPGQDWDSLLFQMVALKSRMLRHLPRWPPRLHNALLIPWKIMWQLVGWGKEHAVFLGVTVHLLRRCMLQEWITKVEFCCGLTKQGCVVFISIKY